MSRKHGRSELDRRCDETRNKRRAERADEIVERDAVSVETLRQLKREYEETMRDLKPLLIALGITDELGNWNIPRIAVAIAELKRLRDSEETAWGIIANAYWGDWDLASTSSGWKKAAERWRDAYHGGPPGSASRRSAATCGQKKEEKR